MIREQTRLHPVARRHAGRSAVARARPIEPVKAALRSRGEAIEPKIRIAMEARLGHDLRDVRIHADDAAAAAARSIDAAAFTVGRDVVFAEGRYRPGSAEGRRLLAHELTHVVQDGMTPHTQDEPIRIGRGDAREEHEAHLVAAGAMPGRSTGRGSGGAVIRRQEVGSRLRLKPPPRFARSMGSLTIDSFALDSAAIPAAATGQVTSLAGALVGLLDDYPGGSVEIVGHTDATGTEAHNEELGQQRAEAVRDRLAAGGVPAGIMSPRSAAASLPAVPSRGQEPRNRRVQVIFTPESRLSFGPSLHLTPPSPPVAGEATRPLPGTPGGPPILPDINRPETPEEAGRRIFRPIPPGPQPERRSGVDVVNQAIDRALRPLIRGLPGWAQDAVRNGAHAAWQKGADALLDNALDQAHVTGPERDAIKNAFEAARRQPIP